MKNLLGVIQGRLVPKYKGRYQAHPVNYWQGEFQLAANIGLDCIEFILDFNDCKDNPLIKSGGIDEISSLIQKTSVSVKTICADYFMEQPLHSKNKLVSESSLNLLESLIINAELLNVTDIVIPCVDMSSLSSVDSISRFIFQINKILPIIEEKNINLSLETDLSPQEFSNLLVKLNSKNITVNYDIGNSAGLGYNIIEELDAYGDRITDIHIKDRVLNGSSVILGEGNADFDLFFNKIKELDYQGPFIMQAYRDDEGFEIFCKQFDWIKRYLGYRLD